MLYLRRRPHERVFIEHGEMTREVTVLEIPSYQEVVLGLNGVPCTRRVGGAAIHLGHNGETLAITVSSIPTRHEVILGFDGPLSFQIVRDDARKKEPVER